MTRRDLLSQSARIALALGFSSMAHSSDAKADSSLAVVPGQHGGYGPMINRYRLKFGRRLDYQQGFINASQNTGKITELPAGVYGVLIKDNQSNQIEPTSSYPVGRAGYLHTVQGLENPDRGNSQARWLKAKAQVINEVRREIINTYPDYENVQNLMGRTWLLDNISLPVVTLENYGDRRIETFHRVPTPGTREYHLMATKKWADHHDQGRLKHDHAFHNYYDESKSLYDNLTHIYGPELQALSNAAQSVKNKVAAAIRSIDRARGGKLSSSQKNTLNAWLGVTGTPYEI